MPTNPKLDRLQSQLLTSGLSGKDQPLYQVIKTLIDTTREIEASVTVILDSLGAGKVNGPLSSTDNAIARWDGITGKLLQDSGILIDDGNILYGGDLSSSSLTFKSTSGVGTTDFIKFLVGNNGAVEALRIVSGGNIGIRTSTPNYAGWNANRTVISAKGVDGAVLEQVTDATDADNVLIGAQSFFSTTSGNGTESGRLDCLVSGTTATDRGGALRFFTKADAGALVERFRINNAGLLQFAGTSSSFPALKRSTTHIQARLADDSDFTVVDVNGILFPATQVPSADANTLDDYDESSFSPIIGGATSETGQTYSIQVGRCIKIGKEVHVSGYVALSNKGTITGSVQIKGLPFPVANISNYFPAGTIGYFTTGTSYASITSQGIPNTSAFTILAVPAAGAGSPVTIASADITNSTDFEFSFTYLTDN